MSCGPHCKLVQVGAVTHCQLEGCQRCHRVVLEQWVIYWDPSDFPDKYVVRRWEIGRGWMRPTKDVTSWDMLEEARMVVPDGLFRIPGSPNDDPTIVEVWT